MHQHQRDEEMSMIEPPRTWRKSTHSGNGGNCVEVSPIGDNGMDWYANA